MTIGNFDGVHRGHAALVREARRLAGPSGGPGRVIVMAFDPHPAMTLAPDRAPAMIMPFDRRVELLRSMGVDEVVKLEPTRELLGLSAESFIDRVVLDYAPVAFVEGRDFCFGQGRSGDVGALAEFGRTKGFGVLVLDPVETDLTDQSIVTCSSTITRWLIERGRVSDAMRVLGRGHELTGYVVRGDRRGRELGFPTANLVTACLLPQDGVYAGIAHLPDGRTFAAAVHVGGRATFGDATRTVEAYLVGWRGPLEEGWPGAAEYGWGLRVELIAWLRDQAKFEGIEPLVAQIHRDVARTVEMVEHGAGMSRPGRCAGGVSHQEVGA